VGRTPRRGWRFIPKYSFIPASHDHVSRCSRPDIGTDMPVSLVVGLQERRSGPLVFLLSYDV
jgi:hypothetical protein